MSRNRRQNSSRFRRTQLVCDGFAEKAAWPRGAIRKLDLAQTLSKLLEGDRPISISGTRRGGAPDMQAVKGSPPKAPCRKRNKPVSYRGTTTSSTGSRRPSQLSKDLRRAIFLPARLISCFFLQSSRFSDHDPPSSTSSTVQPFCPTRCSWRCSQAGEQLTRALPYTAPAPSDLRRQSLFAGAQVGEITCGGEHTSSWSWSGCGLRCRRATYTPTRTSKAQRSSPVRRPVAPDRSVLQCDGQPPERPLRRH